MVIHILLSFPPLIVIFLLSLFVSVLITVVYKFATNQKVLKALHEEMKSMREEIKKNKDPSKAMELNKHLMEKTMQQMKHSMKSTIITIVPMFLIFGWMSSSLAFHAVSPGEEFETSITFENEALGQANITSGTLEILTDPVQEINGKEVRWALRGTEGMHNIVFNYGGETYEREVILTDRWEYADPYLEKENKILGIINIGDSEPVPEDSNIKRVAVELNPVRPFGDFRLFGWQPGWLSTYFLFTLLLTLPVRKLMKVH